MNTHRKIIGTAVSQIALLSAVIMTPSAHSAVDGTPYAGVQLGYGITHLSDSGAIRNALEDIVDVDAFSGTSHSNVFSGRVYGGYMFTDYLGLEGGYTYSSLAKSSSNATILATNVNVKGENRTNVFDILAVYRVPVMDKLSLNLKAGGALVLNEYSASVEGVQIDSQKATTLRPKFGIGMDYAMTDSIDMGLSYEITPGTGDPFKSNGEVIKGNSGFAPTLQLISANLRYSFK